jgi:hypothetical protein
MKDFWKLTNSNKLLQDCENRDERSYATIFPLQKFGGEAGGCP